MKIALNLKFVCKDIVGVMSLQLHQAKIKIYQNLNDCKPIDYKYFKHKKSKRLQIENWLFIFFGDIFILVVSIEMYIFVQQFK